MGRNAIVKALSKLASQKIIKQSSPGKYGLSDDNKKYIFNKTRGDILS